MTRIVRGIASTVAVALVASRAAQAQEALLPSSSWGLAPSVAAWHFSSPVTQSIGPVSDVLQVAVPLRIRARFSDAWSLDLSGAVSSTIIHTGSDAAAGVGTNVISLTGLTDVRARLTGPLFADGLAFTAGVNLPTGMTKLNSDQTAILQTMASPALKMPVGTLGMGLGGTVGVVGAQQVGAWALALGASVEERTQYTPIEIALSGATADTKLTPGTTLHFTAGADTPVGEQNFSVLVVADIYAKDQLSVTNGNAAPTTSSYKLGPQLSVLGRFDLASSGWREASANLGVHMRSGFTDEAGVTVPGSSATYVDASLYGIRGGATGSGFIIGVDARHDSGLTFTSSLVGAAATAAGVTLGVDRPGSFTTTRFVLHGQYGQFDTGVTKTTGFGASITWVIAARGGH
jgi:hypothetical protein